MEKSDLPILILEILEANHHNNWEPALTYPLPPDPGIDLIDDALDEVLNGLSYVTDQVAQKDATFARHEIERAAARLVELTQAKLKAFAAWLEESNQRRVLRNFESDTQH
jgi:hypothetical protein